MSVQLSFQLAAILIAIFTSVKRDQLMSDAYLPHTGIALQYLKFFFFESRRATLFLRIYLFWNNIQSSFLLSLFIYLRIRNSSPINFFTSDDERTPLMTRSKNNREIKCQSGQRTKKENQKPIKGIIICKHNK